MSRTKPAPSVLSPNTAPSSKRNVLTAPAFCARALTVLPGRPQSCRASNLNGSVTFSPAPPRAVKWLTACSKPPAST